MQLSGSNGIQKNYILLAVLILVFIAGIWPQLKNDTGDLNFYVHQADAFLHGRLDIAPQKYDTAYYNGKYYVPYPPVPAILLLPFVAILGIAGTKVMWISLIITILNIFVLRDIFKWLNVKKELVPWLLVAFFTGTAYWMVLRYTTTVYYFAHIVSVSALLLAIREGFGKGRGWLAGLFLAMAILSRQLMVYSTLFMIVVLWQGYKGKSNKSRILNMAGFFAVLGIFFFAYLGFNYVRFGNPLDTGYMYIQFTPFLKLRIEKYGLFNIAYVPFNFINLFLQGFHVNFSQPLLLRIVDVDHFGTSITFASPFVFAAFWAKGDRAIIRAAWISICLAILHMLFYHNNGWYQINAHRFTLDFLPVLMVLVALSAQSVHQKLFKFGIIYSSVLNILALLLVPLLAAVLKFIVK